MSSNIGRIICQNWVATECPFCKTVNWVYCGNPHEDTGIDIYSCKCFGCHKFFWLDENSREMYDDFCGGLADDDPAKYDYPPDEADYEDGTPEPTL